MSKKQTNTTATLKTATREKLGSRASRSLRAEGRIPVAVRAGDGQPHVDASIDEDDFLASRRKHQHVYELDFGSQRETVIVNELAWDTFGDRIEHVEFRRVDLTKKTEVEVEIAFTGHPKGQLNHLMTHVRVRALPTDIPDEIEVSVADLEPGTNVSAAELKVPANVELLTPKTSLVARISVIKIEILESAAAPAAAAEGAAAIPAEGAAAAAGAAPAAPGAAPAKGAAAAPAKGAAPAAAAEPKKGGDKK